MKKLLLFPILLAGICAFGQALDFTYSTNLFYGIPQPTNIFCGSNSYDPGRDTFIKVYNKINANIALLWAQHQADVLAISNLNNLMTNVVVTNGQSGVNLHGTFYGTVIFPSNTWSLASVTNSMTNFSFALTGTNGQGVISLQLSNGVPYIKQQAP